jgi:hypothetical protein
MTTPQKTTGGEIQSAPHGKWEFAPIEDKHGYGDELRIIEAGSGTHPQGELLIARVNPFLAEESREIAHLITAAPELLSALKIAADALEAYSGGDSSDLPAIYQAIAWAGGRKIQLENDWKDESFA